VGQLDAVELAPHCVSTAGTPVPVGRRATLPRGASSRDGCGHVFRPCSRAGALDSGPGGRCFVSAGKSGGRGADTLQTPPLTGQRAALSSILMSRGSHVLIFGTPSAGEFDPWMDTSTHSSTMR
jgi:hypothetical protein